MPDFSKDNGRKTAAYVLIGVAAYVVLANTGLLDWIGIGALVRWAFRTVFDLLPAAILIMGVLWLVRSKEGDKPLVAWFITLFGGILLVSQFGLFGLSFGEMFLPMWLVIIAFMLMNPRKLLPRRLNTQNEELLESNGKIQLIAFMGGSELKYTSRNLKGGDVVCFWGGYEIDFTDADMEGEFMELNLICIMGGVEIKVPSNWEVEKRGAICIMGGFSNKTKCLAEQLELPRKKLIISGLALMGGGEVRN